MCSYKAMRSSWVAACIPLGMALAAILLVTPASQCAAAPQYYTYNITDLDPSGSGDMYTSQATGINNNGQVVGWQQHLGYWYVTYAFRWEPLSGIQYLGNLSGDIFMHDSQAYDINSSGQVAGWSHTPGGGAQGAFLWTEGGTGGAWYNPQVKFLGTLGGSNSFAYGINDMAHVVGRSDTSSSQQHAFLYRNDMADLGTLGGVTSEARRINRYDQVVGTAQNASGQDRAFLWSPGAMDGVPTNPQMKDLGDLGGGWSRAYGMNDQGGVVGSSAYGTQIRAFAWDTSGGMRDLGTLGGNSSVAYGTNNLGQIVGSANASNGQDHAFIWNSGVMRDLNYYIPETSGWTLTAATGINDSGQICGYGTGPGGYHPFLLTPAPPPVTHVLCVGMKDDATGLRGDIEAQRVRAALARFGSVSTKVYLPMSMSNTAVENRAALISMIETMKGSVRGGDTLVFFIAAHGYFEGAYVGNFSGDEAPVMPTLVLKVGDHVIRWVSPIPSTGDERLVLSNGAGHPGITDDEMRDLFVDPVWNQVNKLFLIDSCYSGGFIGNTASGDSGDLTNLPRSAVVAACPEWDVASSHWDETIGAYVGNFGTAVEKALDALKDREAVDFFDLVTQIGEEGKVFEGSNGRILDDLEDSWGMELAATFELSSSASADFDLTLGTPEPSTLVLLTIGGLYLGWRSRRRELPRALTSAGPSGRP